MHLFNHSLKGVSLTDTYFPTEKGLLGITVGAAIMTFGPQLLKLGTHAAHKKKLISDEAAFAVSTAAETMANPQKGIAMMASAIAANAMAEEQPVPDVVNPAAMG